MRFPVELVAYPASVRKQSATSGTNRYGYAQSEVAC